MRITRSLFLGLIVNLFLVASVFAGGGTNSKSLISTPLISTPPKGVLQSKAPQVVPVPPPTERYSIIREDKTILDPISKLPTGTVQTLKIQRPDGGEKEEGNCTESAVVTVLATEITYGEDGSEVPVRLDYSVAAEGGGPWEPTFGGQDLVDMAEETMSLDGSSEYLQFLGKMAYPSFDEYTLSGEYESTHPTNVLIALNGENFSEMGILKGVHDPYGSQKSVQEILQPLGLMDDFGNIILASDEMLLFFELGTSNTNSPAFDMQDLVVKVKTQCDVGSEVILRDSIGVDNTTTNDNFTFNTSSAAPPASWYLDIITLSSAQDVELTTLRMIIAPMVGLESILWENFIYTLRVWNNPNEAIASPQNGTLGNFVVSGPNSEPPVYGYTADTEIFGELPTYEVTFDLTGLGVLAPAGGTLTIGVDFYRQGTVGDMLGVQESTETGESDIQMGTGLPNGWQYAADADFSLHSGRYGVEVRGTTQ